MKDFSSKLHGSIKNISMSFAAHTNIASENKTLSIDILTIFTYNI